MYGELPAAQPTARPRIRLTRNPLSRLAHAGTGESLIAGEPWIREADGPPGEDHNDSGHGGKYGEAGIEDGQVY